jgi:hypothetical protein
MLNAPSRAPRELIFWVGKPDPRAYGSHGRDAVKLGRHALARIPQIVVALCAQSFESWRTENLRMRLPYSGSSAPSGISTVTAMAAAIAPVRL